MLLSRTRWFAPDSAVGVWWLAHCHGFRVEPPPYHGPAGTVHDVGLRKVGGRAELLIVRIGAGRVTRVLATTEVAAVDPERRVIRLHTSLRRAARLAKRHARRQGREGELRLARE